MSEYLSLNPYIKKIENKKLLFSLINDMFLCTENMFVKKICICKEALETLEHLFNCKLYSDVQKDISFEKIYNGSVKEQDAILKIMKVIINKRSEMTTSSN